MDIFWKIVDFLVFVFYITSIIMIFVDYNLAWVIIFILMTMGYAIRFGAKMDLDFDFDLFD